MAGSSARPTRRSCPSAPSSPWRREVEQSPVRLDAGRGFFRFSLALSGEFCYNRHRKQKCGSSRVHRPPTQRPSAAPQKYYTTFSPFSQGGTSCRFNFLCSCARGAFALRAVWGPFTCTAFLFSPSLLGARSTQRPCPARGRKPPGRLRRKRRHTNTTRGDLFDTSDAKGLLH